MCWAEHLATAPVLLVWDPTGTAWSKDVGCLMGAGPPSEHLPYQRTHLPLYQWVLHQATQPYSAPARVLEHVTTRMHLSLYQ